MNFELEKAGFIQWSTGVKAVTYNRRVIVLSEVLNDFVFFDDGQSKFLLSVLGTRSSKLSQEDLRAVDDLISHGLISIKETCPKRIFQDEINSKGAFECDWALGGGRVGLSKFNLKYFIKATRLLLVAKKNSDEGKLHQLLEDLRGFPSSAMVENELELIKIASNVNLAVFFLWRKVKCLEFSYAVARIAFRHNIKCRFVVGVQTHPFISHAWVEGDNGVVFDRKELPKELAKIVLIGK